MNHHHVTAGLLLFAVVVVFLAVRYARAVKIRPLPARGWTGLAVILLSELFLLLRWAWVVTFFTPLAWTGYVLLIDALVASLKGRSLMESSMREFLWLAFFSVPLWLVFEEYNWRLENWVYVGMPDSLALQTVGGIWAFATIWPAIFETAEFANGLGFFKGRAEPRPPLKSSTLRLIPLAGLLLITLPVLSPVEIGRYLFGAVWVGFVLLLDPVNYLWKGRSLLRDFERGDHSTFLSFMVAGGICGVLWEFWNYWAGAKWIYVFPIGQRTKVFEMPLLGYLGFLPFALECLAMHEFLRNLRDRLLRSRTSSGELAAGFSS